MDFKIEFQGIYFIHVNIKKKQKGLMSGSRRQFLDGLIALYVWIFKTILKNLNGALEFFF